MNRIRIKLLVLGLLIVVCVNSEYVYALSPVSQLAGTEPRFGVSRDMSPVNQGSTKTTGGRKKKRVDRRQRSEKKRASLRSARAMRSKKGVEVVGSGAQPVVGQKMIGNGGAADARGINMTIKRMSLEQYVTYINSEADKLRTRWANTFTGDDKTFQLKKIEQAESLVQKIKPPFDDKEKLKVWVDFTRIVRESARHALAAKILAEPEVIEEEPVELMPALD